MESFFSSIPSFLLSALAVIVVFSLVILIHELGHFTAAKWFKVKVEEFGMGLPPKAKVLYKKGDTEYTLNWIPFGGFVRMFGESDVDGELTDNKDSFSAKPVWQRIIIASAGVFMNFLLAYILIVILFLSGFKPLAIIPDNMYPMKESSYLLSSQSFAKEKGIIKDNPGSTSPLVITSITPDSQASRLGISDNSRIITINDIPASTMEIFTKTLKDAPAGSNITIALQTSNGVSQMIAFPKEKDTIGVTIEQERAYTATGKDYKLSLSEAPVAAAVELKSQITYMFSAVGQVFGEIFTSFSLPKDIGGPVQIASTIGTVSKEGISALIILSVLLSVNLGVFNILPIPALDGGRILFMIYEVITRKRPNQKVETYIHVIGYVFILGLILLVTYQDIVRLFVK
ncbi:MAG: M50 family metallopeptidase [Candidatus Gracilibacteria bacterium]